MQLITQVHWGRQTSQAPGATELRSRRIPPGTRFARSLQHSMAERVCLSVPHVCGRDRQILLDATDPSWPHARGPHAHAFGLELGAVTGGRCIAALCSGTVPLHLVSPIAGVESGDSGIRRFSMSDDDSVAEPVGFNNGEAPGRSASAPGEISGSARRRGSLVIGAEGRDGCHSC